MTVAVAVICVLIGTFFQAVHGVVQTDLTKNKKVMSVRGVLLADHGVGFLFFLTTIWWWDSFMELVGLRTDALSDLSLFWMATIWTTFWNATIIQYASAKSRQAADATLVTPYQGITPGLITGSMLLLREIPSKIASIGIGIISIGTYIHGRENVPFRMGAWREWLKPFEVFYKIRLPENYDALKPDERSEELKKAKRSQVGVRWAAGSAGAGTMGLLGDGIASRHGPITVFYTFYMGAIFLWHLIVPKLWAFIRRTSNRDENQYPNLKDLLHNHWCQILLLGLSYSLHYIFVATAYRVALVSSIGTLKRFSIVMTAVLAYWLLKERVRRRLLTASIITCGAILVGLDPEPQTRILNAAEEYAYIIKSWFGLE